MNEVKTTVCGTEYHLLFNGYAMFAAQDMFENRQLGEIVQDNTAEGFVNLCRVFCLLAEQGELARRYEGSTGAKRRTRSDCVLRSCPMT